ncbi:hypothetical protein HUJ05_001132 [Dendroctonus ponderosae]|nr:hypothetical protein HUJ05_001132 [Dendroctonus ponderosae]
MWLGLRKPSTGRDKLRIEKPFLEAVETTLGDRYTSNVENIYKITIKFIIETLVKGFENANAT